jgi:hypothetical protein
MIIKGIKASVALVVIVISLQAQNEKQRTTESTSSVIFFDDFSAPSDSR